MCSFWNVLKVNFIEMEGRKLLVLEVFASSLWIVLT